MNYVLNPDGSFTRVPLLAFADAYERRKPDDPVGPGSWRLGKFDALNFQVSTVFLFLDHNHFGTPPILWETLYGRGKDGGDRDTARYHTEVAAWVGHWYIVAEYLLANAPADSDRKALLEALHSQSEPVMADWLVLADMLSDEGKEDAADQIRLNWARGSPVKHPRAVPPEDK